MSDEEQIKQEMIGLFSTFLSNPEDSVVKEQARELEKKYSGILSYSEHAKKDVVSQLIIEAIQTISLVYEYGLYEDTHPAFSKNKILGNITNQLELLINNK